jgi:hypothetical protein
LVSGDGVTKEQIARQTRVLAEILERELNGARVEEVTSEAAAGMKGDVVTLGVIAITFLTSGAAVALINCIRALLVLDNHLIITIKRSDGSTLEINAQNVGDAHLRETLHLATGAKS